MLVTLGSNINFAGAGSVTLPYACKSISKVFVKVDDTSGATQAFEHGITITLGQRVIVQSDSLGLWGYSNLSNNTGNYLSEMAYCIDLGSHELLDNENVYVTINARAPITGVDISALVDEPLPPMPLRYTDYSTGTFTSQGCMSALGYNFARGPIDEDQTNVEIRDAYGASSPRVASANNWYWASSKNASGLDDFALLVKNSVPQTTTFNYARTGAGSTMDTICAVTLLASSQRGRKQANEERKRAVSSARVAL